MKVNEHQAILTPRLLLVPYSSHHVPTYHEWMQDEVYQEPTILRTVGIFPRTDWDAGVAEAYRIRATDAPGGHHRILSTMVKVSPETEDAPDRMVGDVNLFLYPCEEGDDVEQQEGCGTEKVDMVGELEIMIARPSARGKGLAKEALQAFIWYISTSLPAILEEYAKGTNDTGKLKSLSYLRVKIDKDNTRSINLFKSLCFSQVSEPNYFGEVELRSMDIHGGIADATGFARKLSYGD
ncbi:unnamed protein product [Alternaria alternata]